MTRAILVAICALVISVGCGGDKSRQTVGTGSPQAAAVGRRGDIASQTSQGCSPADEQRIAISSERATQAIQAGDVVRFVNISREIDAGLSPGCRRTMSRRYPMGASCTQDERSAVLEYISDSLEAAMSGDLERYFDLTDDLEDQLSAACWIAVNRHTDPTVLRSCTDKELNQLASYASPARRALRSFFATLDLAALERLQQVGVQAQQGITISCVSAAMAFNQRIQINTPNRSAGGPSLTRLPSVYDHGGGTYSMPGVGACTPSGCMAF